jgi:ACS family tartrate transporter-like MFS transporter
MAAESVSTETRAVDGRVLRRKITWRIVPLLFMLYVVAWMDRANVSFAREPMQHALGFSDSVFGYAFGTCFYAGYLLLEIPGALFVELWSARKWFARILITWGVCSMGTALVRTPAQFYLARFLLGLAEAGFFPGIIVYFTHWFPRAERGRAMAGMLLASPFSIAAGARLSAWLLNCNAVGLAGWQLVFVVEGLPAVVLGVGVLFLLSDRPRQAKWLAPAEKDWLEKTLQAERLEAAAAGGVTLRQALRQPTVWLLALGILATNTGAFALILWMPAAVKNYLLETGSVVQPGADLNWTSIIYACGMVGVLVVGWSSDGTGDRKWHCVIGQAMSALCLAGSVLAGPSWTMVFALLCLFGFFTYFWPTPFWVLPTLVLSASAAAVSIGFINVCANAAGLLGPALVGQLRDIGIDDRACLLVLAACYALGGVLVALVRIPPRVRSEKIQNPIDFPPETA